MSLLLLPVYTSYSLFESHVDQALLSDIRNAINTGLVLGTNTFMEEIEKMTGNE